MTSQLSISQMELATMKKQEQEIRQQRDALLADVDLVKAELSKLRLVHSGMYVRHLRIFFLTSVSLSL